MDKLLHVLFYCHRLPERSFFYKGKPFPICARCTGILIGYVVGIIYACFYGNLSLSIAILLILPLVWDGGFQAIGKWQSTNKRRLFTGILAGIGVDFLFFGIISFGFQHGQQLISTWN
jgi:uncharacterized membrane protein